MTREQERLATLAALFAPAQAPVLLGFLGGPEAAQAAAFASRLLARGRDDRLRALETALEGPSPTARRARALALAEGERGSIAAALLAAGGAAARAGPVTPLFARLLREQLEG